MTLDTRKRKSSTRWISLILSAATILSTNTVAAQAPAATPTPIPQPGDVLAPFQAEGIDGQTKQISYPKGSVTVLFFFLSGCPTCHRMIPEWNRAFERRPKGINVIGVLMDQEPPGFFMATPISFPVVRSPGREFLASYKIHRAPVTLRIGPSGKVEEAALGIVDPIRLGEIMRP
jgi:peroxiredoxin